MLNKIEENHASKKADELMNQFNNFLNDSDEEVKNDKQIKSKLSQIQDENLKLKEVISNLKKELNEAKSQVLPQSPKVEVVQNTVSISPVEKTTSNDEKLIAKDSYEEDEEINKLKQQLKESQDNVSILEKEIVESRKKAQVIMFKKDHEAERLIKQIKNLESQIENMKESINNKQESEPSAPIKVNDLKSVKITSEIPQDFFDDSSEDRQDSPNSKEDKMKSNDTSPEKISSSVNDEEAQEKIKSLQNKISELENTIKLYRIKELEMSSKVNDLQKSKSLESVNTEYIKNIYVNYLKYKAMKNDKEAKT